MNIQKTILTSLCVCILPLQMVFGQNWAGSGTVGDPYQVSNAVDLAQCDDALAYYTSHFILVNDIDCSTDPGHPLWPRANQDPNRADGIPQFGGNQSFGATFDGQGFSILNRTNSLLDSGIFTTFTIKNIVLSNVLIRSHYLSYLTGVAAVMPSHNGGNGSFFNIQVYGVVSNNVTGGTGGMFGGLGTTMMVSNCTSYADVYGIASVGGISGSLGGSGTIKTSHAHGLVEGSGQSVGGLVGALGGGTIFQCSAHGEVNQGSGDYGGGLVGQIGGGGTIRECFSTGDVNSQSESGGLVGGTVGGGAGTTLMIDSYATGDVGGSYAGDRKGGFMGEYGRFGSEHIIENCYSTGDMNSSAGGGFAGEGSTGGSIISNCFAAGGTIANSTAGFSLPAQSGTTHFYNNFWTNSATSDSFATKVGNASHFHDKANPPVDTWDSDSIWYISGSSLPCLRWQEDCNAPPQGMMLLFQ